ncbi:MAG: methionyl-tRNA formyltransferase [Alphaproteobacteria bacterium]|nr:methionyl-tRNA formyltransferase [Alphaproteobacteria bacterium]
MNKKLRVAFMGSPIFAVATLNGLVDAGYDIPAVYCQNPKPVGRGQKLHPCPVHAAALDHNIPVFHPTSLKDPQIYEDFLKLNPDVVVVAAYGHLIPENMLKIPPHGFLNVHASLLPRWRGAAPINRAILAGDNETGISIMKMEKGLDTGDVSLVQVTPIYPTDTFLSLHDRLAIMGKDLTLDALTLLAKNQLTFTPQPSDGITYAPKLNRREGEINWHHDAQYLERQIRAFYPWPGSWFSYGQDHIIIHEAKVGSKVEGTVGTIINNGKDIICGNGYSLELIKVQKSGKQPMSIDDFLRGYPNFKNLVLV